MHANSFGAALAAPSVTAAIWLAPLAGAKDVEGGQVCTGPQNGASTCVPKLASWPPPASSPPLGCMQTGATSMACGRRAGGLASLATQGTGDPTTFASRHGAGGKR
jgi:hypothetical protein